MAVGNEKHESSNMKMLHIKRAFTDIHTTKVKWGEGYCPTNYRSMI